MARDFVYLFTRREFNMENNDGKEAKCKRDYYRSEIIRIISEVESVAVLEYLYYFIKGKVKAE